MSVFFSSVDFILLQSLALAFLDQIFWQNVPNADSDGGLCVQVEVDGPVQTFVLRVVEVNMFGPFHYKTHICTNIDHTFKTCFSTPWQKYEMSLDGFVEVEEGGDGHENDEESEKAQTENGLRRPNKG